jgi:hypothetical protein
MDPENTHSTLVVVPKKETKETNNAQSSMLVDMLSLVKECRQVAQFGFTYEEMGKLEVVGSNTVVGKSLDGRTRTAEIQGQPHRPESLRFLPDANNIRPSQISIDYSNNIIVIDRLSSKSTPFVTVRYKMVSVSPRVSSNNASFSWQTYKEAAGDIIGSTVIKGSVAQAKVSDDGKIEPGKILEQAKKHPVRGNNSLLLYIVFLGITLNFLFVVFYLFKNDSSRKK